MEQVNVLNYLISCPSDVTEEVKIIYNVIESFNNTVGFENNIIIRPLHWSKNIFPDSGRKAQDIINTQIVAKCDGVIAVFWTKFGSPTDTYDSGTEEEIELMLQSGKHIMLYFSNNQISPAQLAKNIDQYKKVEAFKERYKNKGIYDLYNTIQEFQEKFNRHILQLFEGKLKFANTSQSRALSEVNAIEEKNEILTNRLLNMLITENTNLLQKIFSDSISHEVSKDIRKKIQNCSNREKSKIQITLEKTYSFLLDESNSEIAREQCCYYMGFVSTKKSKSFLKGVLKSDKSDFVLRGTYLALYNFEKDISILNEYMDIVKCNPKAAAINAGYHQVHYGDKFLNEKYDYDYTNASTNSIYSLYKHLTDNSYRHLFCLDIYTINYFLEYCEIKKIHLNEIKENISNILAENNSNCADNDAFSLLKRINSLKKVSDTTYLIEDTYVKKIPTTEWYTKIEREYKDAVYIDDDFYPIVNGNDLGHYKELIEADYEKFDYIVKTILDQVEASPIYSILDLGCSYGAFINTWIKNRPNDKAYGIEMSESSISASSTLNNSSEIFLDDIYNMEKYIAIAPDIITAFDVVEHLYDIPRFIHLLEQCAKVQTIFCLYIPVFGDDIVSFEEIRKSKFFTDSHIYFLSKKYLIDLIKRYPSLEIINCIDFNNKTLFIIKKFK